MRMSVANVGGSQPDCAITLLQHAMYLTDNSARKVSAQTPPATISRGMSTA